METQNLAKIVKSWNDGQLAKVMVQMDPEKAAALLGVLDPKRAARLSQFIQRESSLVHSPKRGEKL
jgi:flagellar motility protein MotE (MotC chaperone)